MTEAEQAHKLAMIAQLDAPQLRGWWDEIFTHETRPEIDGERAEMHKRARQLNTTMEEVCQKQPQ